MKEYILKPITTPPTVAPTPAADKSAVGRNLPPRQPLPTAVIDPLMVYHHRLEYDKTFDISFDLAITQIRVAIGLESLTNFFIYRFIKLVATMATYCDVFCDFNHTG